MEYLVHPLDPSAGPAAVERSLGLLADRGWRVVASLKLGAWLLLERVDGAR